MSGLRLAPGLSGLFCPSGGGSSAGGSLRRGSSGGGSGCLINLYHGISVVMLNERSTAIYLSIRPTSLKMVRGLRKDMCVYINKPHKITDATSRKKIFYSVQYISVYLSNTVCFTTAD